MASGRERLAAQAPAAPQPTFRVEANYVEIDAVVTDSLGAFTRGLTRDDFEVFDDKNRQDIRAFSLIDIPLAAADRMTATTSGADAGAPAPATDLNSRVYVIAIDSFFLEPRLRGRVRDLVRQFVGD